MTAQTTAIHPASGSESVADYFALDQVMARHVELHERFLGEARTAQEAMVAMSQERIEASSARQGELAERIRENERERLLVSTRLARRAFAGRAARPSVRELALAAPEPFRSRILENRERLRKAILEVKRTIELNRMLAEQTLGHVDGLLRVMAGTGKARPTYGADKAAQKERPRSLILDRKV